MSAFVLDDAHIDAILEWHSRSKNNYGRVTLSDELTLIGRKLIAQNWRSVEERYRERTADYFGECPEAEAYVYRDYGRLLTPIEIVKACDCYDYQACETPDYRETEAASFIDSVRYRAICKLPGYDAAAWGIKDDTRKAA
jgi:hypothetical protein